MTKTQTIIASIYIFFLIVLLVLVTLLIVSFTLPAFRENKYSQLSPVQRHLQQLNIPWRVKPTGAAAQADYEKESYEHEGEKMHEYVLTLDLKSRSKKYQQDITADLFLDASIRRIDELMKSRKQVQQESPLPVKFDARRRWKKCPQIRHVYDQASCGSCWAHAAVSTISDRTCISQGSKFKDILSVADIITCCEDCGQCAGGNLNRPFKHWVDYGLVTAKCLPYPFDPSCGSPCKLQAIKQAVRYVKDAKCPATCAHNGKKLWEDKHRGSNYYSLSFSKHMMEYSLRSGILSGTSAEEYATLDQNTTNMLLKMELVEHGPIATCFDVFEDFIYYKSGIYAHTTGGFVYNHCVKLIGWGHDKESGIPYWIISNSWGKDWGEEGFGRIAMMWKPEHKNKRRPGLYVDLTSDTITGLVET